MLVILALETTSDVCSVALGNTADFVVETQTAPRQHNRLILVMVDKVCASLGIDRQSIDCVSFSAGPGSFTGVRLGAAVAQGIATGVGAKIYRAPTSLCMGERIHKQTPPKGEFIVRRTSRRDLVYEARLAHDDERCHFVTFDVLRTAERLDKVPIFTDLEITLSALEVLELAERDRENWREPHLALPIYVAGDHPWVAARK